MFVFSLPHGNVGDSVLEGLEPYLSKGDIIIDAGNEHWGNTERRQGKCATRGIRYVGMGVSGGYQAARRGPSMCPGSDDESLDIVLPLLRKVAAKDTQGRSCTGKCGLGGSGNYVKMIHNGIEHGMMSAIAEAWGIMVNGLGMEYDEVGDVFEKWDKEGQLVSLPTYIEDSTLPSEQLQHVNLTFVQRGTFLVHIGADICRIKDDSGTKVLSYVLDKVVQDITGEEGTGIWSNTEAIEKHIPAPTLGTAHYFRLASADRNQRIKAQEVIGGGFPPQKINISGQERETFLESLRMATYSACLMSFAQGLNVIERADKEHKWNINYGEVLQIWRAGCIIQADFISDELLRPILEAAPSNCTSDINLLYQPNIMKELKSAFSHLKTVVAKAIESDQVVPALSASLEYIKYQTNTDLPASFYEAQLDYFGAHMFDKKGEPDTGAPTEGKHHYEWKPA